MVELLATALVVILAAAAEALHALRVAHVARLAFGPAGRAPHWTRLAPPARIAALGALTWGLATLLLLDPKVHRAAEDLPEREMRHLVMVLDVSPSMRLVDAGPDGKLSRRKRAQEIVESLLARVAASQYLISVIATYNGAIPIVEKTRDLAVVRNIMDDLPLNFAFPSGGTDLFAGLAEAARVAHPWRPGSATLLVISDGDTVPATGMPRMPASVAHTLVLGVGNPRQGAFIDGRQSKQEAGALRQIAARLHGVYHDGNEKHISSAVLREIGQASAAGALERLTRREYALAACGLTPLRWRCCPGRSNGLERPGVPELFKRNGVGPSGASRSLDETTVLGPKKDPRLGDWRVGHWGRSTTSLTLARKETPMRILVLAVWLLLPILAGAYHCGPGQQRMEMDSAADLVAAARQKVAEQQYAEAAEIFGQSLATLPKGQEALAQRIRLERAKSELLASHLPAAYKELDALVPELQEAGSDPAVLADAQASLASAKYYRTWLMRLEGEPRAEWEPEIESARQLYRRLAEEAVAADNISLARDREEDLEATIGLARMDLSELQALPLPCQCKGCCSGNCRNGKCKGKSMRKPQGPNDARGASSGPPPDNSGN